MNRNTNSHFAENPRAQIQRSRFDRSHSVKFSFNTGDLIPFMVEEVLPGDTFSIDTSKLVRMQSLITPCMDNLYLDTYYFFVPNRLTMDKWKNLMGENTDAPWIAPFDIEVPQVQAPVTGWKIGSLADFMGIPTGVGGFKVSALPFRAYALIWNEWFRDENLQYPQVVNSDKLTLQTGYNVNDSQMSEDFPEGGEDLYYAISGASPLKACKFKDYFTSCLPSPQKGPDVTLSIGGSAPVYAASSFIPLETQQKSEALKFYRQDEDGMFEDQYVGLSLFGDTSKGERIEYPLGINSEAVDGDSFYPDIYPANLWSDLSNSSAATVNQLRLAFQMQRIYEKDARGGTRYIEILANHFGVTSPDSRLQRPEYLGGNRMLINVNQVIQTSESANTPQGNPAAYSLTVDQHSDFTHSFVEHGFLIGVCVARYAHTYQQGLDKFWTRKKRFDYYFPSLANIGEQPVYKREIYLSGVDEVDDSVFGYQEAWADYRYKPNRVCSEMRSDAPASLDVWHLADDYDSEPYLSASWIEENKSNVDRVLAVNSSVSNQFFADFYIHNVATRPMPLFSIPGLLDHH